MAKRGGAVEDSIEKHRPKGTTADEDERGRFVVPSDRFPIGFVKGSNPKRSGFNPRFIPVQSGKRPGSFLVRKGWNGRRGGGDR